MIIGVFVVDLLGVVEVFVVVVHVFVVTVHVESS